MSKYMALHFPTGECGNDRCDYYGIAHDHTFIARLAASSTAVRRSCDPREHGGKHAPWCLAASALDEGRLVDIIEQAIFETDTGLEAALLANERIAREYAASETDEGADR